jgi:hypothetical protein
MGILTLVEFEVIDLVEGIPVYAALVNQPWGQQMKYTISLKRDRNKIKGSDIKIITPWTLKKGNLGLSCGTKIRRFDACTI